MSEAEWWQWIGGVLIAVLVFGTIAAIAWQDADDRESDEHEEGGF